MHLSSDAVEYVEGPVSCIWDWGLVWDVLELIADFQDLDLAVAISIEVFKNVLDVVWRAVEAESVEKVVEFKFGDVAVVVLVELFDCLVNVSISWHNVLSYLIIHILYLNVLVIKLVTKFLWLLAFIVEIFLKAFEVNIESFVVRLIRVHDILAKQLSTLLLVQPDLLRLQENHCLEKLNSQLSINKRLLKDPS